MRVPIPLMVRGREVGEMLCVVLYIRGRGEASVQPSSNYFGHLSSVVYNFFVVFLRKKTVADENVQKNMNQMSKSLKQVETDVKNAQKDKTAESNDQFVPVMTISFLLSIQCVACGMVLDRIVLNNSYDCRYLRYSEAVKIRNMTTTHWFVNNQYHVRALRRVCK